MKLKTKLLLVAFLFSQNLQSQDGTIQLTNPSFEGVPPAGTTSGSLPDGWLNCGFFAEPLPDIHPGSNGAGQLPSEGTTYLSLLVRDNSSWERAGQQLSAPLLGNRRYVLSLDLCRSNNLHRMSRKTGLMVSYTSPCKLRIWGGEAACDRAELLAESGLVTNFEWQQYAFVLSPSKDFSFLILEAFYETDLPHPYNGNLLLDNASALVPFGSKHKQTAATFTEAEVIVKKFDFTDSIFGTEFRFRLFANTDSLAQAVAQNLFARARAIEQSLAEGLRALHASQGEKTKVNDDTWQLLHLAVAAHQQTKGAFDVARTEQLTDLWRKMTKQFGRIPNRAEIVRYLDATGIQNVIFSKKQRVKYRTRGLRFQLDDLASAYALDEMAAMLESEGHKMFTLAAGGLAVAGLESNDFERPLFLDGELQRDLLTFSSGAMCSAGPGELFFEEDDIQFFDVILPSNGQAATGQCIVTVKATTGVEALAFSKALAANFDENLVQALQGQLIEKWWSEAR